MLTGIFLRKRTLFKIMFEAIFHILLQTAILEANEKNVI